MCVRSNTLSDELTDRLSYVSREIFRAEEAERKKKREEERLAKKAEKAAKGGRR